VRSVRLLRDSLFAAHGFTTLAALNESVRRWTAELEPPQAAADPRLGTRGRVRARRSSASQPRPRSFEKPDERVAGGEVAPRLAHLGHDDPALGAALAERALELIDPRTRASFWRVRPCSCRSP
jgi:hypothetical protein